MKSGFYVNAGFRYNRLSERFDFVQQISVDSTSTSEETIVSLFVDSARDTMATSGFITGSNVSEKIYKTYNSYSTLNLPLGLGYRRELGRWMLGAEFGVAFNLALGFNGNVLDKAGEMVDRPIGMRERLGVSWTGGLEIGYAMSDKWHVIIQPSYRTTPNFIIEAETINQRYRVLSMDLGIRYSF